MRRLLVVYYSLTGHTRQVAEKLAGICGADLEVIEDVAGRRFRPTDLFWLGMQAVLGRSEPIKPQHHDPAEYDLVLIGTPNWAGAMATPVRTYVKANTGRLNQVALFCTEGGRNGEKALAQIAQLARVTPKAQLVITEPELQSGAFEAKVKSFLDALDLPERPVDTAKAA